MYQGILLALAACFVWGLIFIVPGFMTGFDMFEIVLGRCSVYGLLSLFLFFFKRKINNIQYPLRIWMRAFIFAFFTNFAYYLCVVMGVQYSSPAVTALILGISPIVISFYGNFLERECSFKKLLLPSFLIILSLPLINFSFLLKSEWETTYFIGIFCSLISLFIWSWYVVANARFLRKNPQIPAEDWSTVLGISTFILVLILSPLYQIFFTSSSWKIPLQLSSEHLSFIAGSMILGILCSWLGSYFWNRASNLLPVTLAGQLTVFETIFGVIFSYLITQEIPPATEILGIFLMLSSIFYGISLFAKSPSYTH